MKAISLEFYKLRHKHLFSMITMFMLGEIAWAFMAASMSFSRNPKTAGWEPVIAMLSSMNGLFLPILCAIVVSRICDMENKGNTWKMLLSVSLKRGDIYKAKYICSCIIMSYAALIQVFAVAIYGKKSGFTQPLPITLLIRYFIGIFIVNAVIIALQQWVSMAISNQAFSLCVGMIGGFIGLSADLFPIIIRRIFIWSYYSGLSPIIQVYENEKMSLAVRNIGGSASLLAIIAMMGIIIYFLGSMYIESQEV